MICICLIFVLGALSQPIPPNTFPRTWHTWVVTSVVKVGVSKPLYSVGQLIAFDGVAQYTCRYLQQNLLTPVPTRPVDSCDYIGDVHYILSDVVPTATCLGTSTIQGNLTPIGYPPQYLAVAKFLGVDRVAQKNCNHFVAMNIVIGGDSVQVDVWTTTDTAFPCQISVTDLTSQVITTWAFDGFDTVIPPDAVSQCTAPKLVCTPGTICRAKTTVTDSQLLTGLQWVCNPTYLDCSPIQPGGTNYIPNTIRDHSNWAFNAYFMKNRASQGVSACNFSGLAEVVNTTPSEPLTEPLPFLNAVYGLDLVCERPTK
jgi:hypothetical protein